MSSLKDGIKGSFLGLKCKPAGNQLTVFDEANPYGFVARRLFCLNHLSPIGFFSSAIVKCRGVLYAFCLMDGFKKVRFACLKGKSAVDQRTSFETQVRSNLVHSAVYTLTDDPWQLLWLNLAAAANIHIYVNGSKQIMAYGHNDERA